MPVTALALGKVKRSPSLHSEQSSSLSDSRHVSFNQDVSVKRIPKKTLKSTRSFPLNPADEFAGKYQDFVNIPPPSDQTQIAVEAEEILKQLQDIECSVSPTPQPPARTRVLSPSPQGRLFSSNPQLNHRVLTPTLFGSRQSTLDRIPFLGGRLSKSSSDLVRPSSRAMRVEGHSEVEDCPSPADSRLYGLQALSKLDNAVNGKVNNLYRDSSGSTNYSPPPKKNNYTPPKPPRKAPSTSPPNIRKGYASLDELEFVQRRANLYEQEDTKMEPTQPFPNSYTSTNPALHHLRGSPSRFSPAGSRQSPSRGGNHTDSEILSSPSQVLYATISADKNKNSNLRNQYVAHSASQTMQTGFRPVSADRQLPARTLSKENILDEPPYRYNNGTAGSPTHASRSLERFVDSDKENRRQELKARIHVTSPHRLGQEPPASRKPYKTTINTANDTIQYRGFSQENLARREEDRIYRNNFLHSGKRLDTEHYKVPKNKAPVPPDFLSHRSRRHESETSSSATNGLYSGRQNQFASTSLVRGVESRQKGVGEYDREGRRIRSERTGGDRTRAYSGYSTSPDRETSPERYAKPRAGSKGYSAHRSPSSSPTRPPRTRAVSSGEIQVPVRREHSGRRVERTPSTRAAATSRSPIKKIQRVNNEIQADKIDRDQPRAHRDLPASRMILEPGNSRALRDQNGVRTLTLSRDRGDKVGSRGTKTLLLTKKELNGNPEDRLSKFTEYRGEGEEPAASRPVARRASHSVEDRMVEGRRDPDFERERGHSVPPGANIGSMQDFYKTSQYRSMYHLPPSPARPAPVLDRSNKTQTLERALRRERSSDVLAPPSRRLAKTSVSEGEMTDDAARQERILRQRSQYINNLANRNGGGIGRPGATDWNLDPRKVVRPAATVERKLTGREKRPAPQPPTQRVRRSSVEVLETSLSESESPRQEKHPWAYLTGEEDSEPVMVTVVGHQRTTFTRNRSPVVFLSNRSVGYTKAKSDVGGGWANGQSDVDGEYRRSDVETDYRREMVNSVHSEARGRDGGNGGRREGATPPSIYQQAASLSRREVEISQDDDEEDVVRSPTSLAREEERRKILQLEEDRRRKGISLLEEDRRRKGTSLSRSGSRVSKLIGLKPKGKGGDVELESHYSGHSSSSLKKEPVAPRIRLNNGGVRVKRSGSNATTASSRAPSNGRRKMPSSLTSSINSSESEVGSAPQSAGSRGTNASGQSNRSVYLHATAVADIPPTVKSGSGLETPAAGASLKNSKKISRSISLLAPFKPKQPKEKEVNYDSSGNLVPYSAKPPRPPPPPARRIQPNMSRDKKFASSSDLLRDETETVRSPIQEQKSSKVSRSVSMPKDTRLAGWFKKRKRV